LIVNGIADQ